MTKILFSKLVPPRIGKDIIERPRLLQYLGEADSRKLTLFAAPAGYGKTVSMLQFAMNSNRIWVWYHLDAYDNDLMVFLQYFLTALGKRFPDFETNIPQLTEQGNIESRLRLIVTAIVNSLTTDIQQPLLIVLDDFHVITDAFVCRFIQELLEYLPEHIHVAIAGRTMPGLALARLKSAQEICVVGMDELRFSEEETQRYLAGKRVTLPPEALSLIEEMVNGWPALVKLAAGSASPFQNTRSHAEIYEYLATEILERQAEDIRDFLMKIAVFEVITPAYCNLLLRRDDAATMLDLLEKRNLFLIPLAEKIKSYRYHQLFREFLLERLEPEVKRQMQREAGRIAWEQADYHAAVEYFIAAAAENDLGAVLEEAGKQAFQQGRWRTVQRWLGFVTRSQVVASPWLSLFQAQIEAYRGDMERAGEWVEKAVLLFAARKNETGLAEGRLLKARIFRNRGFYQKSLDLLEEASPYLQVAEGRLRFDLPLEKSICLVMTGRFREAELLLKEALQKAEYENDNYVAAYLLEGLGNTYYLQGEYAKALHIFHKRAEIVPDLNLPDYFNQTYVAAIYQEWGEMDQAFAYARQEVASKENLGLFETLNSAYFQLADCYLNRRELHKAEEYFRKAVELLETTSGERFYLTLNKAYLARTLSEQGRLSEAQIIAEQVVGEAKEAAGLGLAIAQELAAPILWRNGKQKEAKEMLLTATAFLERVGFPRPLGHAYAALAMFHVTAGDRVSAAHYAEKTLALSSRYNYCQSFFVAFDIFQPIIQLGLELGIEVAFIQKVLARVGVRALPFLGRLAQHPQAEVRRRIVSPLNEVKNDQAIAILETLCLDEDPVAQKLAAEALERIEWLAGELHSNPPAESLIIKTLGSLQIHVSGREKLEPNWRTAKVRDLLAYLVHHDGSVTQELILENLWTDYDLEKAKSLFHTILYYLRRMFKQIGFPNFINYGNGRYELENGRYQTDHDQFLTLVSTGLRGALPPEKNCVLLEKAVQLYRGEYLAELDYPWVLPYRESMKNLCGEARLWLSRYYLAEQKHHLAVGQLRMLVETNPLAEEPRRLLMMTYAAQGNRGAVQNEYHSLRNALYRELALTPSPEIKELYQKLIG